MFERVTLPEVIEPVDQETIVGALARLSELRQRRAVAREDGDRVLEENYSQSIESLSMGVAGMLTEAWEDASDARAQAEWDADPDGED